MHTTNLAIVMHDVHFPCIVWLNKAVKHYKFYSKNPIRMKFGTNQSYSSPNIDSFMVLSKLITLKYLLNKDQMKKLIH